MNNLEKKISITAEEINVLPLRAFEGDIILIDQPKEISKAVLAELKVESMICGNTWASPKKMSLMRPMINAIAKKAIQI